MAIETDRLGQYCLDRKQILITPGRRNVRSSERWIRSRIFEVFRRNVCNSDELDVRKSYFDLSTTGKFLCGSVLRIIALHIALCGLVSSHAQINILMSQFFFQPQKNHSPTLKPPGFKKSMRKFLSSSFPVMLIFSIFVHRFLFFALLIMDSFVFS